MISIKNILTISSYEGKVLWRNWFFRIIAIAGIGFLTIFNLVVFSELDSPDWDALSSGWVLPYISLLFIGIPQAAAVIFLATGLIKKDKKLDTNEVFFVRAITNLDYVLGKALALFKLFLLLNFVLLCIPFIIGLTNPFATVNPLAFLTYIGLTSVPNIVFTMGAAFLLVTVIRNQPISIVLLIGLAGVQLIYYFDKFSNILDFTGFRLSMLASEMTGFVDIEFALWQRSFYFITGIGFLFITAFLLDRLSGHKASHRATLFVGLSILVISSVIMVKLWDMRQAPIALRQQMIEVNGKWADVPNAEVTSHKISLEWTGNEISSSSEMDLRNNSSQPLETIFFSLNPDLKVDELLVNGQAVDYNKELQIISVNNVHIAPGDKINVHLDYHGPISGSVAHLEVDQERYENIHEFIIFSLKKKYCFLEDDYLLLTKDVFWYPETEIGFNRKSAAKGKQSFIDFQLTVKVPGGKTAISQGALSVNGDTHTFKPEYPLPQISLVIGDYQKKEIIVDSVAYSLYHYPENDFFVQHLDQLGDTLSYLITDVVNEYEDAQRLSYPFKRMQFVEVPLHFTAYNKVYESYQAHVQPETIFWPEEGGEINTFDFRNQLVDMTKQAAKTNQVLTDKQKQANVFNDAVRKVFTKQIGFTWVWEGKDIDNADYSIFPNYYDFNSGVVSNEWGLLNRSIANYLRKDKLVRNDYSREIKGISFTEECNDLMRTAPLARLLTDAEFSKINKSVSLKSQYLFSYLGHTIGEKNFKSFLYEWINSHQHQLTRYEDFRQAMISRFTVDIDPVMRKVYSETSQPAFEIVEVQKYEVMDGDRKRYQVLVKAKNSGESDGVLEVKFNNKERSNDEDDWYPKVNEDVPDEAPPRLAIIKHGETKLFGYVLDEKPNDLTINTIISKNIPSVLNIPLGTLSRREGGLLFDGERVIEKDDAANHYEVIVDNEDPGFSDFSPIKPTLLKTWLDGLDTVPQKYHGYWSRSYAKWLATTGSDFYGSVVRSAHFTRSGDGEKIATWTPALREEGFYDVYVYMRGKNQNEFVGNDGDSRQFEYHYIIKNQDGTDNISYNITNAEPGWNYLGSYYFNTTGGSVSLTDECDLRTVYADAVKWVKQ